MFLEANFLTNIFIWLCEYWHIIAVCGVIIYLLINETTRKVTFKFLYGIFLVLLTMCVVMVGCVWIFGFDNGFFVGWLVIFNLLSSVIMYMSTSELRRVIRLHKKSIHTYGTFIRHNSRGGSVIEYRVDGRKYEYHTDSLEKYKIGCNEVPVLYDTEKPENSCVEKHDFLPATVLIIASVFLETGMIIITVYFCFAIFP